MSNNINNNDYQLPKVQKDSISCLSWCEGKDYLAASSWNSVVRIWQVQRNNQNRFNAVPKKQFKCKGPVLSCCWSNDGKVFGGGVDNLVHCISMNDNGNNEPKVVAKHDKPIKSVKYIGSKNLLLTGSWDSTVGFWDLRQGKKVYTLNLPGKVCSMDAKNTILIVAISNQKRNVCFLDIRKPNSMNTIESPLKEQTRTVSLFPDTQGWAIGSIEGRCSIRYFSDRQKKGFSFKCHREKNNIYALNDIKFHPHFGTFATVGSDGAINYWDKEAKSRLKLFSNVATYIPCCDFNKTDGNVFAYADSYDWSKGPKYYNKNHENKIYLHYANKDEIGKDTS